jgi:hypothetical protein
MYKGRWDRARMPAVLAVAARQEHKDRMARGRSRRHWAPVVSAIAAVVLTALAVSVLSLTTLAPARSGAHILRARAAVAQRTVRLPLPGLGHGRFYRLNLRGTLAPGEHVTEADFSLRVANASSLPANLRITSAQGRATASGGSWSDDFFIAINYPRRPGVRKAARGGGSVAVVADSSPVGRENLTEQTLTCLKADAKKWGTYTLENQSPGSLSPLGRIAYTGAELVCES